MKNSVMLSWTATPSDTDQYGIVHHPMYLIWCEKAASAWMTEYAKAHPSEWAERLKHGYIAEAKLKFLKMARLSERMTVCAERKTDEDGPGMHFRVRILSGGDTLVKGGIRMAFDEEK